MGQNPNLLRHQHPDLITQYLTPHVCGRCMSHIGYDWSFCPECGMPTGLTERDVLMYQDPARKVEKTGRNGQEPLARDAPG